MNSDRDLRLAALRRNQKENFVGAEVKKARRVSELRSRQKEKRHSVWDQGREGLAEVLEEEEEKLEPEERSRKAPANDRKEMLLQWKKKRNEQVMRLKAHQPKPFKVGSRNVAPSVPLPSLSSAAKTCPKLKPKSNPPPRSIRASTRAQRVYEKENATSATARSRAAKGKKTGPAAAPAATASKPSLNTISSRPVLAGFNFQGMAGSLESAAPDDRFKTVFRKAEFSPFEFKFRKTLAAADLVTVRGQMAPSPSSGLSTADSPALWPRTPGKDDSRPASRTPRSGKKANRSSFSACRRMQSLHLSPCNSGDSSAAASHAVESGGGSEADCSVSPRSVRADKLSSPPLQPRSVRADRLSSPPLQPLSPPVAVCTRGESSAPCASTSVSLSFRQKMAENTADLNSLADSWEQVLGGSREDIPEEVAGNIDTAIGQARLLIRERFKQFGKLCDGADNPQAERPTHASDLEGFWEMVGFQVEDVKNKFVELSSLRDNLWQRVSKTPKKKPKTKRVGGKMKTPKKAAIAARERMRQFREAKKLQLEAEAAAVASAQVQPVADTEEEENANFDFSKYIESVPQAVDDDLMAFSPAVSTSPAGAFVRDLAPLTPSNRRRSKVTSIASHVVMTPVRRSVRLRQTPVRGSTMSAVPDLADYSVWPNAALE